MHTVIVCGSRDWGTPEEANEIRSVLERLQAEHGDDLRVVEGGAPGADALARSISRGLGIDCVTVWANWEKYGKAAGPRRNRQMLDLFRVDEVIGFHRFISNSKGTKDMIQAARLRQIPCRVYAGKVLH